MKTSVGQTLAVAFGFCNENKKIFLPILVSMYLVYSLSVLLNNFFYHDIENILSTEYLTLGEKSTLIENIPSFLPPQYSEIFIALIKGDILAPVSSFIMGLIYIIGIAILLFLVQSMYTGQKIKFKYLLKSLPKIIFYSVLSIILIVIGLMVYVLPGLILIYVLFYVVSESTSNKNSFFNIIKSGVYLVIKHPDYTLGLLSVITATIFSLNYILIYLNDLGIFGGRGVILDILFIFIRGIVYTWAVTSNMVSYLMLES